MLRTQVGYAGGTKKEPTYRDMGDHTEALLVEFDPKVITFDEIQALFWKTHNPCAKSWSRQYMSVLFTHGEEQRKAAEKARAKIEKEKGKVNTVIAEAGTFWPAEDYHQKYYLKNRRALIEAFRKIYPNEKDLVASTAAARVNGYLGSYIKLAELRKELEGTKLSADERNRILESLPKR